jgi:hypothetical protein
MVLNQSELGLKFRCVLCAYLWHSVDSVEAAYYVVQRSWSFQFRADLQILPVLAAVTAVAIIHGGQPTSPWFVTRRTSSLLLHNRLLL